MIQREIGIPFMLKNGKKIMAVEATEPREHVCDGCIMFNSRHLKCTEYKNVVVIGPCDSHYRKDNKEVIFIAVEDENEG